MLTASDLIARLLGFAETARTTSVDQKWFDRAIRLIDDTPASFSDFDWTPLQDLLPESTLDVDLAERTSVALTVIDLTDEEQKQADAARAAWEDARPTKRARKSADGPRVEKDSDNSDGWTNITVLLDGAQVFFTRRDGGAMSSLYDPAGAFLRSKGETQNWDSARNFIKKHANSGTSGDTTCGRFTVKVTQG